MRVSIDDKAFQRNMRRYSENIGDLKPVFEKVGEIAKKEFVSNFSVSGAKIGVRWAKLAPSTITQKIRLGFGNKPILERTGRLKNAFRIKKITNHSVTISNPVEYAHFHDFGTKKMPRRKIVGLPLILKGKISKMITEFIFSKGI